MTHDGFSEKIGQRERARAGKSIKSWKKHVVKIGKGGGDRAGGDGKEECKHTLTICHLWNACCLDSNSFSIHKNWRFVKNVRIMLQLLWQQYIFSSYWAEIKQWSEQNVNTGWQWYHTMEEFSLTCKTMSTYCSMALWHLAWSPIS